MGFFDLVITPRMTRSNFQETNKVKEIATAFPAAPLPCLCCCWIRNLRRRELRL